MSILKHIWLDLVVTAVIAVAVFLDFGWAWWIVAVYTPLIMLMKVLAYTNRSTLKRLKQKGADVPLWVYHVLYAANLLLLFYDRWWWAAGLWAVIWVLSALIQQAQTTKGKVQSS